MIEFLELCGFSPDEIESQLPRIKRVFSKIGITDEDIERGKQRLNKYYDMELQGVRKIFRLYIRGLADLVLAREEGKEMVVYGLMAPGIEIMSAALMSRSNKIFTANPQRFFSNVVGNIFGKLEPILEAAERKWLKAGAVAHCANVKMYVGLLELGFIPKPDLLVSCGFLCDTAPKTADMMQELWDIPTYCYDTCKDMETMDDPREHEVIGLGVKSLRGLAARLQDMVGIEITDDMIWEVINAGKPYAEVALKLDTLIAQSDPLPISSTHHNIFYRLAGSAFNVDDFPLQVDAISTLYEEVQERVRSGYAAVEKGAPRVFCTLPPSQSDPRLEHLMGELGIANVASENRLYPPDGRRSMDRERPKDPFEAMCSTLYTSMYQTPKARIPALIGFCKSLKVDGVLNRYHAGCRSGALDAMVIRSAITKELNIPVLSLEWENFDPRVYDQGQYTRRFEVFKSMMLQKRGKPSPQ
jgi:benzoyl-CoA reductase/2-hydroxyglutaryl-CoA dehydratase subunit BcrC/BadD/HgdB